MIFVIQLHEKITAGQRLLWISYASSKSLWSLLHSLATQRVSASWKRSWSSVLLAKFGSKSIRLKGLIAPGAIELQQLFSASFVLCAPPIHTGFFAVWCWYLESLQWRTLRQPLLHMEWFCGQELFQL